MIAEALERVMAGEPGRLSGLAGHPHLPMWVQHLGDRPGLLIGVQLASGTVIDDGRGFEIKELSRGGRPFVLICPTAPGLASPAFLSLAEFVYRETARAKSREGSVSALLHSVYEFRKFFSKRPDRLSSNAMRGLFAELNLLLTLVRTGLSPVDALTAWSGPYGATDFTFAGLRTFEVKSCRSPARGVKVSSEYQLFEPDGDRYLFVLPLQALDGGKNLGVSLIDLVSRVKSCLIGDAIAMALWDQAVDALGFDETDSYYLQWHFESSDWLVFGLTEGFPSLTPLDLAEGISSVSYSLSIPSLSGFVVQIEDVLSLTVGGYGKH